MKQRLIDYKNKLKEESDLYFDWASINEDDKTRSIELALSKRISGISDDLNKIIYKE